MAYLTDRKRAEGKGASHTGTEHHWYMTVSAAGLTLIIPFFLFVFGRALGSDYASVQATFANPFVAILTALVLVAGLHHFNKGFQTVVEDYVRGIGAKVWIILMTAFTYGLMATGLFALAKLAL